MLGVALALALVAFDGQAQAVNQAVKPPAGDSPIHSVLTVMQVTAGKDGAEKVVTAQAVQPGELLEYRATYQNRSKSNVKALVATLPIPEGTQFVSAVVAPNAVLRASTGAGYQPVPLKRQVKHADGRTTTELVPLSEYRSLQWPAATLASGESFAAVARVRVTPLSVDAK